VGEVCSFIIARAGEKDKSLQYNGGLLKDKAVDSKAFGVPKKWMVGEKWDRGGIRQDMSCIIGGKVNKLADDEIGIL
jgi:alpha 1,3-mannosyltransferase